jgi:broad specificity phosphatase PhoE
MTTRIFLVRHGETTLSAEDRFAGSTDVPLGANGRAQAERLAARLADAAITAAYCSPLQRTVETAVGGE